MNLDAKDKKILGLLKEDFRISVAQIARELKISHNAVKYRMTKLKKNNYIKNGNCTDPKNLGKGIRVVILMEPKTGKISNCISKLNQLDEIISIHRMSGTYSIMAHALFKSDPEFTKFIDKKLCPNIPVKDCLVHKIIEPIKEGLFI